MLKYILKKLLIMAITLWIIITLTFVLMVSVPGSPFNSEGNSNEIVQANLEKHYNLDKPIPVQYLLYLKSIVTLEFGPSISQPNQTVNDMIGRGFPISAELGIVTVIVALISGVTLGVLAALRHNGVIDYLSMGIAVLGISVPNFIL